MISIDGKKITINDVIISLPYKIEQNKEYVLLKDRIIIVYDIDEFQGKNNVACYSLNGELIWNIKKPSKKDAGIMQDSIYVGVSLINNECRVIDFYGRNFLLNTEDGTLSNMICVK